MPIEFLIISPDQDRSLAIALCHGLESRNIPCFLPGRDLYDSDTVIATVRAVLLCYTGDPFTVLADLPRKPLSSAFARSLPIVPLPMGEQISSRIHWLEEVTPQHQETIAKAIEGLRRDFPPQPRVHLARPELPIVTEAITETPVSQKPVISPEKISAHSTEAPDDLSALWEQRLREVEGNGPSFAPTSLTMPTENSSPGTPSSSPKRVTDLAVSPDSSRLLIAGIGSDVRIRSAQTGEAIASLPAAVPLLTVTFLHDSRYGVAGGEDGKVRLFDCATGNIVQTLPAVGKGSPINTVAASSIGASLLSGDSEGFLRLWNLSAGETDISLPAHEGICTRALFTPDARRLISIGTDGRLRVFDTSTGTALATYQDSQEAFTGLSLSASGNRALVGGKGEVALLYDLQAGRLLRSFPVSVSCHTVLLTPDGLHAILPDENGFLSVVHTDTGAVTMGLPVEGANNSEVTALAHSPGGNVIYVGLANGQVQGVPLPALS